MNLGFSTKWPDGTPTYFIEQIWNALLWNKVIQTWDDYCLFGGVHTGKFDKPWDGFSKRMATYDEIGLKHHTIREGKRWKAGMDIHFVINNRTKNRFQFAPVIPVKSVQDIIINNHTGEIIVDGRKLDHFERQVISSSDGFASLEDFLSYFARSGKEVFEGQIIHWTSLKYQA